MPSGPPELHEKWDAIDRSQGAHYNALKHLLDDRRFRCRGGILLQPKGHTNSDEDESAISYLCMEWDYGYQPYDYKDKEDSISVPTP